MNTLRSKLLVSILPTIVLLLGMSFFAIGYLASTNLAMLMEEDTKHQAEKYAENVSSLFMEGYAFTYTNAVHQEYLKETGQTDREALKRFLANYLERHEKFYAIWTQFEPNAWDGRDAEFAGKPGYSDIGLNSPWVYRNDGKVIIGAEGSYAETEEYYAVPKSIKKPYVTTPYHDETTADTLTMMSTITIPLFDSDGTFIGVTGTDIALSTFQDLISGLKFFESGYGTIISSDGTIVAHPKIELVGKNVKELDTEEANALLFATIEQGLINSTTTFSTATQEKVLRLFAPIEIAGTGQRWVFSSSIPLREVNAVSNKILRYIIIFSLAFLFAVSLIILVLASRIVKPVKALADGMKILSTGDFTKKMDVQSRDEIGMIGKGFNEFVDKLSSMLKDTKEANQRLSEVGKLLSEDMNQVSSAVTQIASASKNSKEVIERQVESVTSVSGVMEGISKQVEALGRLIEIQSANITESSASIEEMIANIRSVTSNAGTAASMTRELVKASQIGKEKMDAVTAQVKRISERSQGLIDTNTIIANIASQTNMLAMNAAIEAAHAGNAGKGFSVVADEVRKLAEISTKQSKGIKEHLKEITAIIESVAASAENTALSFEDISRLVTDVDNIQGTIKHAMSEQSEGSKQILSSLAEMNRATTDVSEGATEMKDGTAKIYVEIENLVDLSSEVNQGIAEIASGASHIESSVTHVKELSEKNKALIADVLEKTEQFHVS